MAASSRSRQLRALLLVGCVALAAATTQAVWAAEPRAARLDGPVTLDAASSDVDYRSNTVVFRDIVITQGAVRVAAAEARATGLDFEDSTWSFSGAVRINVEGGALRSDSATVKFGANRVASARIRGTPAEFQQALRGGVELARGRAGTIEYDFAAGTVKLVGNAWLTDGSNEIRGQELTYDLREQRVQSGTRPGQPDRVQITIRPRESGADRAAPATGAEGSVPAPGSPSPGTPPSSPDTAPPARPAPR